MADSLAALLERSRQLQTSTSLAAVDLPSIQLGLDQIEAQSRRIAGRSLKEAGHTGNACVPASLCLSVERGGARSRGWR